MFAALLSSFYVLGNWLKRKFIFKRFFLWLIVASGPLSMIAIEAGWWLAEVGRQPWVLRGLLRTKDAHKWSSRPDALFVYIVIFGSWICKCLCFN